MFNNPDKLWDKIKIDSENYALPVHYPDYFNPIFVTEAEILELLYNWGHSSLEYAKSTSRIFVNGGLSYAHSKLMFQNMPLKMESLTDYHFRIFGNQPTGVFMTQVERFHDGIASKAAKLVSPIARVLGYPHFNCSISLIFGNYGKTPFGVHYDFLGGRTIHLMVTGQKKMKTWQRDDVNQLTGKTDRNFYWGYQERLMDSGRTFNLKPKDFFLLPINQYHLGISKEFSVDLSITIINADQSKVLKGTLAKYSEQLSDYLPRPQINKDFTNHDIFKSIDKLRIITNSQDWLIKAIEDYTFRLKSNSGLINVPLRKSKKEVLNQVISIRNPFFINFRRVNKKLDLYVRGRIIKLHDNEGIIELISLLNSGKQLHVNQIISELKQTISKEDIVTLLELIYEYGGIEII